MRNCLEALKTLLVIFLLVQGPARLVAQDLNIKKFGAKGDGITMNTKAIQQAIDECAERGGGKVVIPEGRFLTGSLHLKSNVNLHLDKEAVLLGSTKRADYDKNDWYALILAKGQHDIGVTGSGTIDGQGKALAADVIRMLANGELPQKNRNTRPDEQYRPQLIDFWGCQKVKVTDVTLRNAACWVETYHQCDRVYIDRIRVESTAYWNNDGIDIVDCSNVRLINSYFDAADDGICLKSESAGYCCENILIKDCKSRSSASGVKFGTASFGGFRNIKVKNIYVWNTYRSAIALECVDGGFFENIDIDSITAVNTGNAFFIRRGQRDKTRPPGIVRNIRISNLTAEIPNRKPDLGYELEGPDVKEPHNLFPASIMGLPGYEIRDVTLKNIKISFGGGGNKAVAERPADDLDQIPERPSDYPEFSMLGELPAWGVFVRHAAGIQFKNVQLTLISPDYRSPFLFDDVKGLTLTNLPVTGDEHGKPVLVLRKVSQAKLGGSTSRVIGSE